MPKATPHEAAIKLAEKRIASIDAQMEKLGIRRTIEEKFLREMKAQASGAKG